MIGRLSDRSGSEFISLKAHLSESNTRPIYRNGLTGRSGILSSAVKRAKRVYIAGPITGQPEDNYQTFHEVEVDLRSQGFEVVNPQKLDHSKAEKWRDFMRTDIRELMECDAVTFLPGWEKSKGARLECIIAKEFEIETIPNAINR
jgi:phosphotransacetylase